MPQIDRVTPNATLPKTADVVVIGGGVAGICTALELAARGLKVAVVEKGEIAAEQSSRNWGWCRQMGRDARELPLILESMRLWRGMNERIGAETGFRTCGITYLAETAAEAAKYEAWLRDHARPAGIASEMLSGAALDKAVPGASTRFPSGLYTPSDGRAEPFIAVPAIARAAQKAGVEIFTSTAARGLETTGGRVSAVVTERGAIACNAAVVAGGYWSRHFLANLAIDFPQLGVLASVQRTTALENGHTTTFSGGKFTARKRLDGGFTVTHNHLSVAELTPAHFKYFFDFLPMLKLEWRGFRFRVGRRFLTEAGFKKRWALDEMTPFEQVRILDPEPVSGILDEALAELKKYFPAFAPLQVAERWAGIIDAAPDAVPTIAPVQALAGLYVSSGYSGHGFGLGPGAGKLMAEIITGEKPCVDPTPFRFERFRDGSRPVPTTGV
ncbi:MAG: FAD-binding oxidoreductase [Alphaproteobacteria bacterium]|nr:FAD-binding oxidoreductase [Alphaproteobacteria bacterium]